MADTIADVLDEALTLADGGEYRRGDIVINAYPGKGEDKVRIFKLVNTGQSFKKILVAGNLELTPPDTESMATVIEQGLLTEAERDQILAAVSDIAASGLKTDAPAVEHSTEGITDLLAAE